MPLRIQRQQAARRIERFAMTDAGEYIEDFALVRRRIVDAARRQQRQVERPRNADRRAVAMLFLAVEVALQFDVDITRTEDASPVSRLSSALRHSRLAPAPQPAALHRRPSDTPDPCRILADPL